MHERPRRLPQLQPWVTYALLGMIIFSLLLHLLTWVAITRIRTLAKTEITALADQIGESQSDVISANFPVNQEVPIQASIPVRKQLIIPVNTTVNIDESVTVPIGGLEFPIPVQANVPISTTVPIEINETVDISTTVALNLDIPIRVPIANTSIERYLTRLEQQLRELAAQL